MSLGAAKMLHSCVGLKSVAPLSSLLSLVWDNVPTIQNYIGVRLNLPDQITETRLRES